MDDHVETFLDRLTICIHKMGAVLLPSFFVLLGSSSPTVSKQLPSVRLLDGILCAVWIVAH